MESLRNNESWDLVVLPNERKHISSNWVFDKRLNAAGQFDKYKDWLVAKGYSQVEGIKSGEIFSCVAKLTSIGVLIPLVVTLDIEVEQMDVNTKKIHGHLQEEIYMNKTKGCIVKGETKLVCKLKKSLYGLNQLPRMWY